MESQVPSQADFLKVVKENVTLEEFKKIVVAAKTQAMSGDRLARDFLSKYLLPENPEASESETKFKKIVFVLHEEEAQ